MTWPDGTRVRWRGYGSPGLVALAEEMNEQERVAAEARRQSNRGGAMDTLFDEETTTDDAAEASLADRLRAGWEELRTLPLGGRGHLADLMLEAAEAVAFIERRAAQGSPAELSDVAAKALGPFVRGSETSRQAALANYPRAGSQRRRILDAFGTGKGRTHGFTREELARWTRLPDNSIRPRVGELIAGGWIGQGTKDGAPATRPTALGNESEVLMLTAAGLARIEATGAS